MNYGELLTHILSVPKTWGLESAMSGEEGLIRSVDHNCILSEVCEMLTGKKLASCQWRQSASAMNLSITIATRVYVAADNSRLHPDFSQQVRDDLLSMTGVTKNNDIVSVTKREKLDTKRGTEKLSVA